MKIIILVLLLSSKLNALNVNCSIYSPYYLSDEATINMAYWQMISGAVAIVFIANNFLSSWYFFHRQEKRLCSTIKYHTLEIAKENEYWQYSIDRLEKLLRNLQHNNDAHISE